MSIMRKGVQAARRRFQKEVVDEELKARYRVAYKQADVRYKRKILSEKRKSWREFLEATNPDRPFGEKFKFMKGSINYRLNLSTIKMDNVSTHDLKSTYKALLEQHFGQDHSEEDTFQQSRIRNSNPKLGKNDKLFSIE